MNNTQYWLNKIGNLKVDKAHNDPAPHKPILLLIVLELVELELLQNEVLPLTPEIAFRFLSYWTIVAHRRTQAPNIRLPFHHLQTDGFWSAYDEDGKLSPDKRVTQFVVFNPDFFDFIRDPISRQTARRLLIEKYFQADERVALYTLLDISIPNEDEITLNTTFEYIDDPVQKGRDAKFRLRVVAAYDYSCVLTGYRLTTLSSGCLVDAAHIHQFADSGNDDPCNGLALSKNAHWLFDKGIWSISNDYKVLVAIDKFIESNPDGKLLKDYHGQKIRLPNDSRCWPNLIHLEWHRKHKFQGTNMGTG